VVELFCGRGNGLHALQQLGFLHIEGVDLSAALAARYKGGGHIYTADCRKLPFAASSRDIAIVQGGLHHLLSLQDLEMVMTEIDRVLRPNGFFVTVEPWRTPFLSLVHILCGIGLVRRISNRFDALAVMINHERPTYEAWLRQPETILSILKSRFKMQRCFIRWGKIVFVGMKK
jgi:SAM-dependent methyltransferase